MTVNLLFDHHLQTKLTKAFVGKYAHGSKYLTLAVKYADRYSNILSSSVA
jgi:hypothetical protein